MISVLTPISFHLGLATYLSGSQFLWVKMRVFELAFCGFLFNSKCFMTPTFIQIDFLKQPHIYKVKHNNKHWGETMSQILTLLLVSPVGK